MIDIYSDPEYLALLRRILENPADDAPRLVWSDWLEEHGEEQRARYIRESIDDSWGGQYTWDVAGMKFYRPHVGDLSFLPANAGLTVRRGFVEEIRLTCAEFVGVSCSQCSSTGMIDMLGSNGEQSEPCPRCRGTGHIPGVAKELFERHPITRVVLADKKPLFVNAIESPHSVSFVWFSGPTLSQTSPNHLPDPMSYHCRAFYKTESAALDALSDACVRYGRSLVGLPALEVVNK